ncbi:MAG: glycosyltransferase [Planctomycetota bacterium]
MLPKGQPAAARGPAPAQAADAFALTVVLPIFAERDTVPEIVEGLCRLVPDVLHEVLLLVAGRAPEDTLRVVEETAARFPVCRVSMQKQNPGLGFGVRQGIDEATGTHILLMDSDGEMDVETVPHMVAAVRERKLDMVIGSRWAKGGGVEGYDQFKYYLNRGYQQLFGILYRTRVRDLTLGFKLARADVMKSMPWDSQFHDIGCETTMRVIRTGYAVGEVPTVWRKRKEGESSNPFRRNFKYVWKALGILFKGSGASKIQ